MLATRRSPAAQPSLDVVVDTETTGLGHRARPPRQDGVLQIGCAWRSNAGKVETWSSLCNPGPDLLAGGRAKGALDVNGRTEAEVLAAEPVATVAAAFREHLGSVEAAAGRPLRLLAYNRDFDHPFLSAEPWDLSSLAWGPCIMLAASKAINGPFGRYLRLQDAVANFGLVWPGTHVHDAAHDAHAGLLVAEALAKGEM